MEYVFSLIDRMRQELVLDELANPDSERRSEFAFGRLHGILYALQMIQDTLDGHAEQVAAEQDRRERDFD